MRTLGGLRQRPCPSAFRYALQTMFSSQKRCGVVRRVGWCRDCWRKFLGHCAKRWLIHKCGKGLGVSAKRLASEHFSVKNSTEILVARYRGIVGS